MPLQMIKTVSCTALLFLLAACSTVRATAQAGFDDNPLTLAFIDRMVEQHDFDRSQLLQLFAGAERRDDILELMSKPAEKKLRWFEYRRIFLTQNRIDGGVTYWDQNADALADAAREFGVDPQIIVAILGVETRYGSNTGRHRVLDALSTLAFDYPPRATFFSAELEQYLLLAREEQIDLTATTGSYAGAMGYSQFIPSSYRQYAVDFDADGKRDLWNSPRDIIGSVANYFHAHGWVTGQPVATPARVNSDQLQSMLDRGYQPHSPLAELHAAGIRSTTSPPADTVAALVQYDQQNGPEYWLVFNNFYVITRYNHSPLYAMAVYQLSEEIRAARDARQHARDG